MRKSCKTKIPARHAVHPDRGIVDMPLLREIGLIHQRRPVPLELHRNPGFELTFVLQGEYIWEIPGGDTLTLSRDDMGITQPGVPHRGYHDMMNQGRLLYLVVDPLVAEGGRHTAFTAGDRRALDAKFRAAGNRVVPMNPELQATVRSLTELVERHCIDATVPATVLMRFRIEVARLLLTCLDSLTAASTRKASGPVFRACEYMAVHIEEKITIESLAAAAGLGRTRFHELFAATTGVPPGEYLMRLRNRMACRDLCLTGDSVTEIAFRYGFGSSQYFSTCVRRYTGLSPREYRRKYRSDRNEADISPVAAPSGR